MAEEKTDRLRITDQFRSKNGFVYDLRAEGFRLTLFIAPRENDGDAGDWRVEASTKQTTERFTITEWGPSRVDALQEVGRAWTTQTPLHQLPRFDWTLVEKALRDVRAI